MKSRSTNHRHNNIQVRDLNEIITNIGEKIDLDHTFNEELNHDSIHNEMDILNNELFRNNKEVNHEINNINNDINSINNEIIKNTNQLNNEINEDINNLNKKEIHNENDNEMDYGYHQQSFRINSEMNINNYKSINDNIDDKTDKSDTIEHPLDRNNENVNIKKFASGIVNNMIYDKNSFNDRFNMNKIHPIKHAFQRLSPNRKSRYQMNKDSNSEELSAQKIEIQNRVSRSDSNVKEESSDQLSSKNSQLDSNQKQEQDNQKENIKSNNQSQIKTQENYLYSYHNQDQINSGYKCDTHWSKCPPRDLNFVPITIFDDHNDALLYWSLFNITKMQLIHIDSHSDGFTPSKLLPTREDFNELKKDDFLRKITLYSNIGDFIPIAQYYDMIGSNIVWISSAWQNVDAYNLKEGNIYQSIIGRDYENQFCLVTNSKTDPLSVFIHSKKEKCVNDENLKWNIPIRWYVTTIEESFNVIQKSWKENDKKIEENDPNIKPWSELNLMNEATMRQAASSKKKSKNNDSVSQRSNAKNVLEENSQLLINKINLPYVLDIDLDYFAATDPTLSRFLPQMYPLGTLLHILKEMLSPKYFCIYDNDSPTSTRKLLSLWIKEWLTPIETVSHDIYQKSNNTSFLNEKTNSNSVTDFNVEYDTKRDEKIIKIMCSKQINGDSIHSLRTNQEHIKKIKTILLMILTKVNYLELHLFNKHGLFSIDCETNHLFGLCIDGDPSYIPTTQEIEEKVHKISQLIKNIGKDPYMITIARSKDGYCPDSLCDYIESLLLKELNSNTLLKQTKLFYKPGMHPSKTIPFEEALKQIKYEYFPPQDIEKLNKEIDSKILSKSEISTIEEIKTKWQIVNFLKQIEEKNDADIDIIVNKFDKVIELKNTYWKKKKMVWDKNLHAKLDEETKRTVNNVKRSFKTSIHRNDRLSFEDLVKQFSNV